MKRWLVASGGGSKGAPYHAGFLKGRAEQGVEYVGAAGTSAGGLAALAVVQHQTLAEAAAYIERLALTAKTEDIHKSRFLGKLAGLWNGAFETAKPFEGYVQKAVDEAKIVASGKKLRLGIAALTDPPQGMQDAEEGAPGATAFFTVDETFKPMWRAAYATSAFPGVFEPMLIEGRWCIDGGIQVVTPLSSAIEAGATHVDVVVADTPWPSYKATEEGMPNTIEVLLRSLELAIHRLTWVDVRYTQRINQLVEVGHPSVKGKRHIEMTVANPMQALNADSMVFDPNEAAQIVLQGYQAALSKPLE